MPVRSMEVDPAQARLDAELATKDMDFLRKLNQNLEFLIGQLGKGSLSELIKGDDADPNQLLKDLLTTSPAENLFGAGNLGFPPGGPFTANMGGSPFPIDPTGTRLFNTGILLKELGKKDTREGLKNIWGALAGVFGRDPRLSSLPGPAKRPQQPTPPSRDT